MDESARERDSKAARGPQLFSLFSCFFSQLSACLSPASSICYLISTLNSVLSLYRTRSKMASDDTKPSFTLTYNKPTAKKIEYEDDYIEQETRGGGFEQETTKKKKTLAAANGRVAPPCCQVENCGVDLTNEQYYRRHKVCQFHAKAPAIIVTGTQQRFCQQCSRFF